MAALLAAGITPSCGGNADVVEKTGIGGSSGTAGDASTGGSGGTGAVIDIDSGTDASDAGADACDGCEPLPVACADKKDDCNCLVDNNVCPGASCDENGRAVCPRP